MSSPAPPSPPPFGLPPPIPELEGLKKDLTASIDYLVAWVAIMIWDVVSTFPSEYRYVWKSDWSVLKVLFFLKFVLDFAFPRTSQVPQLIISTPRIAATGLSSSRSSTCLSPSPTSQLVRFTCQLRSRSELQRLTFRFSSQISALASSGSLLSSPPTS